MIVQKGCKAQSRKSRIGLLVACLALGFAGFSASAKRPPKVFRFIPDPEMAKGATLDQTTWKLETDTFRVHLQRLNNEQRLAAIKHLSGLEIDPFAQRPGQPPNFQTFLLILTNHTEESLFFNTSKCWFKPNTAHLETPLNLQRVRSIFRTSGLEMPGAYEKLDRVLLNGETLLQPGETVTGMLVYKFPSPRIKRFTIDVPLTLSRGDGVSLRAGWRRIKE
jgi:hypothetical protein